MGKTLFQKVMAALLHAGLDRTFAFRCQIDLTGVQSMMVDQPNLRIGSLMLLRFGRHLPHALNALGRGNSWGDLKSCQQQLPGDLWFFESCVRAGCSLGLQGSWWDPVSIAPAGSFPPAGGYSDYPTAGPGYGSPPGLLMHFQEL